MFEIALKIKLDERLHQDVVGVATALEYGHPDLLMIRLLSDNIEEMKERVRAEYLELQAAYRIATALHAMLLSGERQLIRLEEFSRDDPAWSFVDECLEEWGDNDEPRPEGLDLDDLVETTDGLRFALKRYGDAVRLLDGPTLTEVDDLFDTFGHLKREGMIQVRGEMKRTNTTPEAMLEALGMKSGMKSRVRLENILNGCAPATPKMMERLRRWLRRAEQCEPAPEEIRDTFAVVAGCNVQ